MQLRHGWTASLFLASVISGTILWFVLLVSGPATALAATAGAPGGAAVFEAQKCNLCHSVSAAGIQAKSTSERMRGPDLAGVGDRHEPKWISDYLQKKQALDGKTHTREFKGSDEELQALIDWLLEQK